MLNNLLTHPTLAPSRKVTAGGSAGALSILLITTLHAFGVAIAPELAAAITTVVSFAGAWLVRERAPGVTLGRRVR